MLLKLQRKAGALSELGSTCWPLIARELTLIRRRRRWKKAVQEGILSASVDSPFGEPQKDAKTLAYLR